MKKIKQKPQGTIRTSKEFSAIQFFYSQKSKIIKLVAFSVVIVIGVTSVFLWFRNREIEASLLLQQAKTSSDYEEIVLRYSFTKTKPLAMISWGRELFNEKKYKEAISVYKKFIKQYQRNNLAAFAYIGLAYCYEETENHKEAETIFLKVKEEFPDFVWVKEAEEGYKRVSMR